MSYGREEFLEVKSCYEDLGKKNKERRQQIKDYQKQAEKAAAILNSEFKRLRSQRNQTGYPAEVTENFIDLLQPKQTTKYVYEYLMMKTGFSRQYVQRVICILDFKDRALIDRLFANESVNSVYKDFQKAKKMKNIFK